MKILIDQAVIDQALEALLTCQIDGDGWSGPNYMFDDVKVGGAIKALRQAKEQAQQAEPVVWMYQDKSTHEVRFQKHMSEFVDHSKTSEVPLYGEPLANHELQCVCGAVWCGDEMVHPPNKTPPRQPLTDEQLYKVFPAIATYTEANKTLYRSIARAIEAAHGIKGEA